MKYHLIASIVFAVLVAFIAISEERNTRLLLVVPLILIYYIGFVVFSMEYEKQNMQSWKKKEKRLIEDTYLKFYKDEKKVI